MAYYDKMQQTKSNRLKPKAYKDKKYLSWLHNVKQPCCYVCNIHIGIQIHHVKERSSDLRNDNEVIPLCYNHHLGNDFSVHGTPKEFREQYPTEEQLKYAETLYMEYNNE